MALPQLENIAIAGSAVLSQLATLDNTHGQQGFGPPITEALTLPIIPWLDSAGRLSQYRIPILQTDNAGCVWACQFTVLWQCMP